MAPVADDGRRRLLMFETPQPMNTADLIVDGTFALRRSLDRLARSVRRPAPPASELEPPEVRPSLVGSAGPLHRQAALRPDPGQQLGSGGGGYGCRLGNDLERVGGGRGAERASSTRGDHREAPEWAARAASYMRSISSP
jgi:hypothetical protein